MTRDEVMDELKARGTEQNRKTFARHGVGGDFCGVSYADLYALQKRIRKDHDLALALWGTGNHDARILATLVADPARLTEAQAHAWGTGTGNVPQSDAVASLLAKTTFVRAKAEAWRGSEDELTARAGWSLLGHLANDGGPDVEDDVFLPHLETIRAGIHGAKNRVREAMNSALIAIGSRNEALAEKALAVAAAVGKVDVDHGQTSCKTPDAAEYIRKTRAHRQEKQAKAVAKVAATAVV